MSVLSRFAAGFYFYTFLLAPVASSCIASFPAFAFFSVIRDIEMAWLVQTKNAGSVVNRNGEFNAIATASLPFPKYTINRWIDCCPKCLSQLLWH
ncbi:hypothetical protein BDQ12DRAFT_728072 [Crucibulum laeve]|uniref:Uncharacterized protein n=1 Tax=Crucibulum laeve TaxID=68775 RepID=A0A5C3LK30_9AGAR|nr:hypothetical protein BDQ12DRAFT_728072 [Crucibulum laeve]